MWYAIEYAYGATVNNNGTRADKVYEFSRRALRDAWVADGPPDVSASGYRATATARTGLVRKADYRYDGDGEAWQVLGEQRLDASPALAPHRAIIAEDWNEPGHWRWVATAPEREIVSWARDTERAAAN